MTPKVRCLVSVSPSRRADPAGADHLLRAGVNPGGGEERSLALTHGATASYAIAADTLVLIDEAGATLATFGVVYLP